MHSVRASVALPSAWGLKEVALEESGKQVLTWPCNQLLDKSHASQSEHLVQIYYLSTNTSGDIALHEKSENQSFAE